MGNRRRTVKLVKNLYIFPYKMGSRSASALSKALNCPQIRHQKSAFKGSKFKTVINWGASEVPREVSYSKILNHPQFTSESGNKLTFFRKMSKATNAPDVVPWTTDRAEAQKWSDKGHTVVCRNSLQGHSGHGIIIVNPGEVVPQSPLYTQYIKKDSEWRIHVMKGQVIDVQRKVRDKDQEPKNWKVRSHDNGFIFIRNTEQPPASVLDNAVKAVRAASLDFGAVDVIHKNKTKQSYVLEVNCAPGLENHTVEVYANAFRAYGNS